MGNSDIQIILQWWLLFLILGTGFLPLTFLIFKNFFDHGYIFSKTISIVFVSYTVFLLGTLQVLPFSFPGIIAVFIAFAAGFFLLTRKRIKYLAIIKGSYKIFIFEEALFLGSILFWSYIRSFNPDIHGLEKYMDYGFINSILRSSYFPPKDMWLTPFPINYYYFGHLVTAVLTKLSSIGSSYTFNLMLATLFALCMTQSFSIGANLYSFIAKSRRLHSIKRIISGFLTALLVTFSGNLHVVYSFFKPYKNENPVPFWQLNFDPLGFPNSYWYPNATRFIYNTIHEFPIYSWVVADLHGHVLDIPFVLLTIAVLLSLFQNAQTLPAGRQETQEISSIRSSENLTVRKSGLLRIPSFLNLVLIGFLLAIMYMTNAWDGGIYLLLTGLILLAVYHKKIKSFILSIAIAIVSFFIFSYPYNFFFEPFASGIGILCAPEFLTDIEKFGPFLFEKNYCQHSPWWQLLILYGFFYFFVFSYLIFSRKIGKLIRSDVFVFLLIILSTFLIILPEFIYLKDIYPAHYRANTMFKLVFQSFIMLSIASGYILVRLISNIKYQKSKIFNLYSLFFIFAFSFLILVLTYPFLATKSYYEVGQKLPNGNYKTPVGLDGTLYLKKLYPSDYEAINWINKNINGQPVILEAQGDSYTDFARVSSNTGLPTVLGWTVHEWLWRGSYDVPSPRIEEIKTIYETENKDAAKKLLKKHNVKYVFVGTLEYQKYPGLKSDKFSSIGKLIYEHGSTKIYELAL
jgi:uncharacterized membrane protein